MLTVLGVLGVLAVLFGAGVVATRPTGGELRPAAPDRADVGLGPGPVTAEQLHRVRFGMTLRGYRMSEVDDVLDRAAEALAEAHHRVQVLEARTPAAGSDRTDSVSLEKP